MLCTKGLVMLLMSGAMQALERTGEELTIRQIMWQMLGHVAKVLELMVFYTVGLGWKVIRRQLRPEEWTFALGVAVPSLLLGFLDVTCNKTGTCPGKNYLLTQFTLHSLCYLLVIVATNFNIFMLQHQISESVAALDTGILYAKHLRYGYFRVVFVVFMIIPTITNTLSLHALNWQEVWVVMLMHEALLWGVVVAVCWLFWPGVYHLRVFELAVNSDSETSE